MASEPHLEALGADIWIVDGPEIGFYGIPFPTRMTVIRLQSGDLFLHSPIRHRPELENALRARGRIRHLVSPNWIHYAYIQGWADAVPETLAWASPKVRERAARKGMDVAFDRDLAGFPDAAWAGEIDQIIVAGSAVHREVVFFHRASQVLILTDLIENMPLWLRAFSRLAGIVAPNGKMPLDMWMTFTGRRDRLARALGQMRDWQPDTVVLAHGDIIRQNVPQRLCAGFRNLAPQRP